MEHTATKEPYMTYPELTFTEPTISEPKLTLGGAAKLAGTSEYLFNKLLKSFHLRVLNRAALQPFLDARFVIAGGKLAVIQTDIARRIRGGWREWTGDAPYLPHEQWQDAQRDDWAGVNAVEVRESGYLAVGSGGLITGVGKVNGVEDSGDGRKSRFSMDVLDRLTSDLATGEIYLNPEASEPDRQFAMALMGKRFQPQRGGSGGHI